MRSIESEIDADLNWREAELASMKLLISQSVPGTVKQSTLLRASVAMLYAHYEGFCKFCWELYLEEVLKSKTAPKHMNGGIRCFLLSKAIKKARSSTDPEFVEFLELYGTLRSIAIREAPEIDTKSNLWPTLFREISENLNLKCDYVETFSTELRALVSRRNDIAHGKKLVVSDLADYVKLERCTLLLMHELAVASLEAVEKRLFIQEHYR